MPVRRTTTTHTTPTHPSTTHHTTSTTTNHTGSAGHTTADTFRPAASSNPVVAQAQRYVGTHERGGRNGHSGNVNPFSQYFHRPAEFWCADFASYCLEKGGHPAGRTGVGFAGTKAMADWYRSQGKFSHTPQVGGPVFLHERGRTDNAVGINHVGIVERIDPNGTIHTIEGNSGNAVTRHSYPPGAAAIQGYGHF